MNKTAAKMGRPRMPKGVARDHILPVRFKLRDFRRIEVAARRSRMTVSEWIRSVINVAIEAVDGK